MKINPHVYRYNKLPIFRLAWEEYEPKIWPDYYV